MRPALNVVLENYATREIQKTLENDKRKPLGMEKHSGKLLYFLYTKFS